MLRRLRALRARLRGRGPPDDWRLYDRETMHHFDAPELPLQPYGLAVPSYPLRTATGAADLNYWFGLGDAWAHMISRFLPASPTVLDIGCGCGKLARFLRLHPTLRYVGVDLFRPSIEWCRRAFADDADRFRFEHFDGWSALYNPDGVVQVREYRLPVDAATVDLVVCGSLFTHLLEPEATHYLAEIARALKPGGQAFISIHVEPPAGTAFAGDEARIDVDEAYFLDLCAAAGLESAERIGVVYGQVVHRLRRRAEGRG